MRGLLHLAWKKEVEYCEMACGGRHGTRTKVSFRNLRIVGSQLQKVPQSYNHQERHFPNLNELGKESQAPDENRVNLTP